MAALESRADTQGVPDGKETVIDIDFTAGQQGTSDGFEEERAKERADYMGEGLCYKRHYTVRFKIQRPYKQIASPIGVLYDLTSRFPGILPGTRQLL